MKSWQEVVITLGTDFPRRFRRLEDLLFSLDLVRVAILFCMYVTELITTDANVET